MVGKSGLDSDWDVWLGSGVRSAFKREPKEASQVRSCNAGTPYLAAGGDGSWPWAGAGEAWMDRTPSGDSAEVTAAGSTPGGRRYRRWNSRAMNPCSSWGQGGGRDGRGNLALLLIPAAHSGMQTYRALLMPSMDLHVVANHLDRDFLWREVLYIQQHGKMSRVRGHLHTWGMDVGCWSGGRDLASGSWHPAPSTTHRLQCCCRGLG